MKRGWIFKRLDAIAEFSQGIQVDLADQSTEPSEGRVRFIRIIDYTQAPNEIRYVKDPGSRFWVNQSDIVMVRYGTPGFIGRGVEGVIANNLFKISVMDDSITNDFLSHFLGQKEIQNYLANQESSTMPAVTFKQLGAVRVVFPQSIEEQQRIVGIVHQAISDITSAKDLARQKMLALDELKDSLLHRAFEGLL